MNLCEGSSLHLWCFWVFAIKKFPSLTANGKNMRPLRILLQAFGQLPGRMPKNPPLPEGKNFYLGSLVSSWFSFKPVDSWFLVLFICYFHGQCPHTRSPAMDLFSARACCSCNLGVEESVVWRVSTRYKIGYNYREQRVWPGVDWEIINNLWVGCP